MTPSLDYQPGASTPRFDITVDRAPVGIAHFDATGRFLYANPQLCAIFGLTRDELLAKTFQEISFPDDLPRCLAMTQQLAVGTIPRYTLEKRFQRCDGSFVFTRVIVTAVRADDGSPAFFLGVVEDLSEQWEAERLRREAEAARASLLERERSARADAELASKLRDEVLAVVAHDLRNPVHTILMSAGAALELPLSPEDHALQLTLIQRAARRMDALIRDLLDVTRIETGRLAIAPAPTNVGAMIADVLETAAPLAADRGVRLEADVPAELPDVQADRDRIVQALGNLVGNALKFTSSAGRIVVRSRPAGAFVEAAVEDTGCGIAAEHQPHVFDRYWQADRGAHRGVGLGLAIVRGIVEAHGGHVVVESRLGEGTTFRFTLPACEGTREGTREGARERA
jgi:PAS domain S-box-containing protein